MKRFARSIARRTGLASAVRHLNRHNLLVVCYHGVVAETTPDDWLLLPLAEFERQIDHLTRHYDLLPVDEGLRRLRERRLEEPTACITFDDGYANNLTTALRALRRHDAPATVYLVTDLVGSDRRLWTTRVEYAVLDTKASHLVTGDPAIDGPLGDSNHERRASVRRIKQRLKQVDDPRRLELMQAILERTGESPRDLDAHRLLSRTELEAFDGDGSITFGAHTRTHPILARLSDERLEEEIAGSVEAVRRLSHVSNTFAYPNGGPDDYDHRARSVLERLGVRGAMTTIEGHCRRTDGPFDLPRLVVGGDMDFATFVTAASGLTAALRPGARTRHG